jgi:replicative DNA helicase
MISNHPAEKAIVSACMANLSLLSRAAADGIENDSFYHPETRGIWIALHEADAAEDGGIDPITFAQRLMEDGTWERIGQGSGFAELMTYRVTPFRLVPVGPCCPGGSGS